MLLTYWVSICVGVVLLGVGYVSAGKGVEELGKSINMIEQISIGMQSAGQIKATDGAIKKKFGAAREKISSIDEDTHETTGEALEGAAGGLGSVIEGIQSGSWQDVASGGLELLGAVTEMIEFPAVFTAALGIISMCFALFGGATGNEESTDGMIERVVNAALAKAKADDLRAHAAGLKKLLTSLSHAAKNYREKKEITASQAEDFFAQAFQGISFFGQLEFYINKYCDDVGDMEAALDDEEKQATIKEDVGKCLEFLNLYCDLSIMRQLFVADLASLLTELEMNDVAKNILLLTANEQKSDMNLLKPLVDPMNNPGYRYIDTVFYSALERYPTVSAYIAQLDAKSRKDSARKRSRIHRNTTITTKRRVLHHGNQTRVTHASKQVGYSKMGKKIKNHVTGLGRETETETTTGGDVGAFRRHSVVFCDKKQLLGNCFEVDKFGDLENHELQGWNDKISSIYVSSGVKITAWNHAGKSGTKYGPFCGPAIYARIFGDNNWSSMLIEKTEKDASKFLRICDSQNLDIDGDCDLMDFGEYPDLKRVNTGEISTENGSANGANCVFPFSYDGVDHYDCIVWKGDYYWCATERIYETNDMWGMCKFGRDWDDKIESISIPAGMMVTAYENANYTGSVKWGPLYGPDTINRVCFLNKWSSMKVERTTKSATKMARICRGDSNDGYCDSLEVPQLPGEVKNYYKLDATNPNLHGCNWDVEEYKMKSMNIPRGLKVETFDGVNMAGMPFGPYTGPSSIRQIDGTGEGKRLRSIRMKRLF